MDVEGVHGLLKTLAGSVNKLSESLSDDLLTKMLGEQLEEFAKEGELTNKTAISELEQAKLLNIYAYLLVSMNFTNLKLNGSKFDGQSPVMQEIKRVKEFMDKVKKAEDLYYKRETAEQRKARESEEFIQKHISATGHSPAVSKKHFEESGTHVRFNDEDVKKVAEEKSKTSKVKGKKADVGKKTGKVQTKTGGKIAKDTHKADKKSKKQ